MSALFLLQMAGAPGTGKSALARMIGFTKGAVVLDKDVIKSALLDAGVEEAQAGPAAYGAFFALADHLLGQGFSVVLDSPSFYESIPAKGQAIAGEQQAAYYFVECACPEDARQRRLEGRARLPSQTDAAGAGAVTAAPPGAYLRVDTTQPIEDCLARVLEYLG